MKFRNLVLLSSAFATLWAFAPSADAQGPVRRGLRRTGEIAVQGTGRVVQGAAQGTGAVVGGAAQGTRAVVGGVADGTRAVVGGAVDGTRAVVGGAANATGAIVGGAADATRGVVGATARGVDAITPDLPIQARAGATLSDADRARDARWRFAQHNGDWWYYSPENAWMYQRDGQWNQFSQDNFTPNPQFSGDYATGYRGVEGDASGYADQSAHTAMTHGSTHTLMRDANGREYICDHGQRVYFDEGQQGQMNDNDQWNQQQTPTPAIPAEAGVQAQPQSTTEVAPSAAPAADGGLSGESPREILQSSPGSSGGTVEPGQTAQ